MLMFWDPKEVEPTFWDRFNALMGYIGPSHVQNRREICLHCNTFFNFEVFDSHTLRSNIS